MKNNKKSVKKPVPKKSFIDASAYFALLSGDVVIIILWMFAKNLSFEDALSAMACAQLFGYFLSKYLETRKKVGLLIVSSITLILVVVSLIMSFC